MSVMRRLPVWLPPALLTLAVTLTGLDRAQLWRDELATWSAATRSIGDLLRLAGTIDAATGPYYLLMHAWVAVAGDSVAALRLPAALAMTGAAALTAVLGARHHGRRVGLLAGLLFAVLPGTSRYGQETRPYALATFLAVLSTLLLVVALGPPPGTRPVGRLARWTGYAAAVAALGLTHLVALTLLAAHGVVVLAAARHARPSAREPTAPVTRTPDRTAPPAGAATPAGWWIVTAWLLALLPATLLVGPLVLVARGQRARQLDWVDAARPADLAGLAGGVAQSGVVGGLLVGLAALGVVRLGRRALLPGTAVILPILLVFAAGVLVPLWVPRYLVFVVPFGCLLAAAALATVPVFPALAVVALAGALGLPDQAALRRTHEWPRSAPIDYAGAARIVVDGQRPGDVIVYSPRESWLFLDLGLEYHLGDHRPRDVLATVDQAHRGDLWAAECTRPDECLAGADRLWLVVAGRRSDPIAAVPGAKGGALRAGWAVERVQHRPGLTVALLTR
ncbi:glycosyltransferase family 39 protein [Micromonospora sp. WMMA1363]|uniref:glycosyltransferase family 39 protein n=1 Tax=Micromonospora sp. WMMA1363 TaxID=3053985 RepID=UPI00259D1558|nr:glycosyltransferase family 39 protein [Micromonospora sp. WMMA1363]MDM4720600.1 glycosyltransferase family 39 protein [Micromonospora sp. WMMA1363]